MAATAHFREHVREHWQALRRSRSGRRFQDRYEHAHRDGKRGHAGVRIGMIVIGILCLGVAAVLAVIPGPAILFFFLAGAMFATESRWVARAMDWSEVRLRNGVAWTKTRWRRMSPASRAVTLTLAAALAAALGFLVYRLVTG